jgi:hypothetical protein
MSRSRTREACKQGVDARKIMAHCAGLLLGLAACTALLACTLPPQPGTAADTTFNSVAQSGRGN